MQKGFSLISFTLIGLGVAVALFLGTFVISSRAKNPNEFNNLFIPVPYVPQEALSTPPPNRKILPKNIDLSIPNAATQATEIEVEDESAENIPVTNPSPEL